MNVNRERRLASSLRPWGGEGAAAEHVQSPGRRRSTHGVAEELTTRKLWSRKTRR